MKNEKVSTALLPIMKIQGMNAYARDLVDDPSDERRAAALRCLIAAQEKASTSYQPIYGVGLVVCPSRATSASQLRKLGKRVTLTADNAYLASFAAVGGHNQIWAGDIIRETLREIEERVCDCVAYVRNEPFETLISMFETVSK